MDGAVGKKAFFNEREILDLLSSFCILFCTRFKIFQGKIHYEPSLWEKSDLFLMHTSNICILAGTEHWKMHVLKTNNLFLFI